MNDVQTPSAIRRIEKSWSVDTATTANTGVFSFAASSMESLDLNDTIEYYLTRFTPPVGATPEEIQKLNYFNLLQRAIVLGNSTNPSK
eukprot:864338-Ditylum_brightwellii.AAC.1